VISRDDVEVKVAAWTRHPQGPEDWAVFLTHKETGLTAECAEYESQIANYDAALAELERRLADHLDAAE
jgi:protein subunit release factor A